MTQTAGLAARLRVRLARWAVGRAERQHGRGRLPAATSWFERAIRLAETAHDDAVGDGRSVAAAAHTGLGRIRLDLGTPDQAIGDLESAQRLAPEAWEAFYLDGCARGHLKDYSAAVARFTRALTLHPDTLHPERGSLEEGHIRVRRGYARTALGEHDAARRDLLDAGDALDDRARTVLAWLQLHRKEWQAAEATIVALPDERRGSDQVTAMLAYALDRQDKLEDARKLYEKLVGSVAQPDTRLLYRHGLAAYRLGRFDSSSRSWTELRQRRGDLSATATLVAAAQAGAAAGLAGRRQYDTAKQQLQACRSAWPGDDGALDAAQAELHLRCAGVILRHWDERGYGKLREELETGWRLAPHDPRYRRYLALLDGLQDAPARGAGRLEDAASATSPDPDLPTDQTGRIRAALRMLQGSWSAAEQELTALPDGDPWAADLLPECLYRAGRFDALRALGTGSPTLRYWRALARHRMTGEEVTAQLERVVRDAATAPAGRAAARVLSQLRRRHVLVAAADGQWPAAADRAASMRKQDPEPGIAEPVVEALILLLGDRRGAGARVLADALRRDPADRRVVHCLALTLFHKLRDEGRAAWRGGGRGIVKELPQWQRCLAVWVVLLEDEDYWQAWRRQAAERYGTDVPQAAVADAKAELQRLLLDALQRDGGPDLEVLFARERTAVRRLGALGGLPLDGGGPPVAIGPLLVRYLRLGDNLGKHAARLAGDPTVDERAATELIASFSDMGAVEESLDAGRPEQALVQLAELRCARCRRPKSKRTQVRQSRSPAVCLADCPEFDARNPAYARLDGKHDLLRTDAALLAVEARMALARSSITDAEADVGYAREHWLAAVRIAEEHGTAETVRDEIGETALGRVDVLAGRRRTDEAITLLEVAAAALDAGSRGPVDRRLAELLTNRAVQAAKSSLPRWDAAVAGLRRATDLHPYAVRTVTSLSAALCAVAVERCRKPDPLHGLLNGPVRSLLRPEGDWWNVHLSPEAVDLIEEGIERLRTCWSHLPDDPNIRASLDSATTTLGTVYHNWAVRLINDGDLSEGIRVLDAGLRRLPKDARLREMRKSVRGHERISKLAQMGDR